MKFQMFKEKKIFLIDFADVNDARQFSDEFFRNDNDACEFTELKNIKGATTFTIRNRKRKIVLQIKTLDHARPL